jgi:hypothetical protein
MTLMTSTLIALRKHGEGICVEGDPLEDLPD